jgi:hypothetical protein
VVLIVENIIIQKNVDIIFVLNQETFVKVQEHPFTVFGFVKIMDLVFIDKKYCVGICLILIEVNKVVAFAVNESNYLIKTVNVWFTTLRKIIGTTFFQRKNFKFPLFRWSL